MGNSEIVKQEDSGRGSVSRQEFSANQVHRVAETAGTSIAARQRALVEARFIASERHPRIWESVALRLLAHCERPRFAEVARYSKPTGRAKNKVTGKWEESFAEGLSARFSEVARQEMGNLEATTSVVFEDDLIRIVSAGVSDLEHNLHDSREITIAKAVEKRGKKDDNTGEWFPPDGREVIGSPRINSYGDPVWLVRATDDEIRSKQNSEISKTQRDATLRLIPKDIRDDCEDKILSVLADPKKVDPAEQKKRILTGFSKMGIQPEDLMRYHGAEISHFGPEQWNELRSVGIAIKEGEITWSEVFAAKTGKGDSEEPALQNAGSKKILDLLSAKKLASTPDKKRETVPESKSADPTKTTAPATSETADKVSSATQTTAPAAAIVTPGDPPAPKEYDEFPDCPMEDGVPIFVKGKPFLSREGKWRALGGKTRSTPMFD